MRCDACGQRNARGARICARCSQPFGQPRAADETVVARGRTSVLASTLVLALALVLVGAGGVKAAGLLQHAMRPQTASDIAAMACTALQSRNYSMLVGAVNPAPVPPNATSAFNATALMGQLRALDRGSGAVVRCTYQQISYVHASAHGALANFALTVTRAHGSNANGILLVVAQQPSGTWQITRASDLIGAP